MSTTNTRTKALGRNQQILVQTAEGRVFGSFLAVMGTVPHPLQLWFLRSSRLCSSNVPQTPRPAVQNFHLLTALPLGWLPYPRGPQRLGPVGTGVSSGNLHGLRRQKLAGLRIWHRGPKFSICGQACRPSIYGEPGVASTEGHIPRSQRRTGVPASLQCPRDVR